MFNVVFFFFSDCADQIGSESFVFFFFFDGIDILDTV